MLLDKEEGDCGYFDVGKTNFICGNELANMIVISSATITLMPRTAETEHKHENDDNYSRVTVPGSVVTA